MDSYSHTLTETGLIELLIKQKQEFINNLRKIIDKSELYIFKNELQLDEAQNYLETKKYNYLDFRCAVYSPLSPHPTKEFSVIDPFNFEPHYSIFEDFTKEGIERFIEEIRRANKGFGEVIIKITSIINLYKSDINDFEKKLRIMWGYFYNEPADKSLISKSFFDDRLNTDSFRKNSNIEYVENIELEKLNIENLKFIHNDLPSAIRELNLYIHHLIEIGESNVKSSIVERVLSLYNDFSKLMDKKSRTFFLKNIYPFIDHKQEDWDFKKFYNFAKN